MDLEKLLPSPEFINQMPGLWVAIDRNSKFLAANNAAIQWTGFKSPDSMIGETYENMHCKAAEQHQNFVNQDKIVLSSNYQIKILGLYCYHDTGWKIVLAEKYPLRNVDGDIIALITYATDLTLSNIIDLNKFLSLTYEAQVGEPQIKFQQKGFIVNKDLLKFNLTQRQSETLFFLLRGKSAKEISKILQLSPRTIEMYFEQLKFIFHCQSKSELIDKAINHGYFNNLPESLFSLFKC